MPEAAMDEHDCPTRRKDNVRRAGQAFVVKPITEACAVERAPQLKLRPSVPRADARHVEPALFWRVWIGLTGSARCHALISPLSCCGGESVSLPLRTMKLRAIADLFAGGSQPYGGADQIAQPNG